MPFEITAGPDIPDGQYPATLEKVETETGSYGPMRKWHWLIEVKGKVVPLSSITSANTGTRSKSYQWLTALIGRAPKAGERIEDPTGTRVLLTIQENEKGYPTVMAVAPYSEPQQVMAGVPR